MAKQRYEVCFVTHEYTHAFIEIDDDLLESLSPDEVAEMLCEADSLTFLPVGRSAYDGGFDGGIWAVDWYGKEAWARAPKPCISVNEKFAIEAGWIEGVEEEGSNGA